MRVFRPFSLILKNKGEMVMARSIKAITKSQAERSLYVDFESNSGKSPSVMGVLYKNNDGHDVFTQYILEPELTGASNLGKYCRVSSLYSALEEVRRIVLNESRFLIAWSKNEIKVIRKYCAEILEDSFEAKYLNAIPVAKSWHTEKYPEQEVPGTPGRGRHTLEYYLKKIGYNVPKGCGHGSASKPIAVMRKRLKKENGRMEKIDKDVKDAWQNMLIHNEHDCKGMREVMRQTTLLERNERFIKHKQRLYFRSRAA